MGAKVASMLCQKLPFAHIIADIGKLLFPLYIADLRACIV